MSRHKPRDWVWAIVRYDPTLSEPETQFDIKEVLHDGDAAEAEVARLNALAAEKRYRYFLQGTRLYPPGTATGPLASRTDAV